MKHLSFTYAILFVILTSFVAAATDLSVSPVNSDVANGESVVVSVEVDSNDDIYGAQFDLFFDPTQLEAQSVSDGGFLSKDGDALFEAVNKINNTEGKVSYAVTRFTFLTGVTGTGNVADITFKALTHNNVSNVTIDNVVIGDPAAANVPVQNINNGTVTTKTVHQLIINEIMDNPDAVSDSFGEYVEIYNPNNFSVNINGYKLADNGGESHTISAGGSLNVAANDYIVLCRNDDFSTNGGFTCDYEYSGFTLDNSADEVILSNEGGHEVDRVEYDGSFPNPVGKSMELGKVDLDNDNAANWREATVPYGSGDRGTPGAENVVLSGPDIKDIQVVSSHEDQNAIILATITDFVPITNVTIFSDHTGVLTAYPVTDINGSVYSFTIDHSHLENGQTVQFSWRAQDSEGFVTTTGLDSFKISNRAPVAAVIPPIVFGEDQTSFFNITQYFSDADGDNISIVANDPDNIVIGLNPATGLFLFQPIGNFTGTEFATFTGVDSFGAGVTSNNVSITVTPINDAPHFTSLPSGLATTEETPIVFEVAAADVDNDTLTFFVNDDDFTVNGTAIAYVPENNFEGIKTFDVIVSDGQINVSETLQITVTGDNDAPEINGVIAVSATEEVEKTLNITSFLSDSDNDVHSLTVTENSPYVTVSGHVLTFNYPNGVADDTVTITVSDGSLSAQANITVTVTNTNDAPVLGAVGSQTVAEDETLNVQLTATDEDPTNDTLTFATDASFGSLDANSGLFTWTPGNADIGTYVAEFSVEDGNGGRDAENVTIMVTSVLQITNVDVTVDSTTTTDVKAAETVIAKPGSSVQVKVTVENKAAESLFGITANATINTTPEGQDLEATPEITSGSTHEFTFDLTIPTLLDDGTYSLDLFAKGVTLSLVPKHVLQTIFIDVQKNVHDILINNAQFSPNNLQCTRDGNLDLTVSNIGQFDEEVTVKITQTTLGIDVTSMLNVSKNTEKSISIPVSAPNTADGSYVVDIETTYFFGTQTENTQATLDIANCAPVLNPTPDQSGTEESPIVFEISASDFDAGDVLTFTSDRAGVNIVKLNNSDAQVTWTPQNADIGAQTIEFTVSDEADSDSKSVNIQVANINDAPEIDSFSPANNPVIAEDSGTTQTFTVTASDPDNDPLFYTWKLDGVTVDNDASYTYTANGTVGTFNVFVNVSDLNLSTTREWTLTTSDVPVSTEHTLSYDGPVDAATNVTISNSFGIIDFGSQVIDLSAIVDLDSLIILQSGAAGVDSANAPALNKPASITLFNLPFNDVPPIFRNSGFSVSGDSLCGGFCSNVVYAGSTLTFDVSSFSVYFVLSSNNNPTITTSAVTTANINEQYQYDVDATDADFDTLTYSLTTNPAGMAIDSSSGLITWTPTNFTTESVVVEVVDGNGGKDTQSFTVRVQTPPKLIISDLDVEVDGNSDKNLRDGSKISEEALPGSRVQFSIELENIFDEDTEDVEIEDIDIEVTIKDIDDGDDLDEDADEFDLKAGDDEQVNIDFTVPLEVDEDTYDVIIDIRSTDENGDDHDITWNLELEVEKEDHDIRFTDATVLPTQIQCSRDISLRAEIINVGSDDEEDVDVEILSEALGITERVRGITLEEGDSDNTFVRSFSQSIDSDIRPGTYQVDFNTYYDGRLIDSEIVDVTVSNCVEETSVRTPTRSTGSSSSDEDVTVVRPDLTVIAPVVTQEEKATFFGVEWDTQTFLVLILLIIFVGLAIFIIGAAIILFFD